ncbi:MAG TPA: VCBS repeat-containing protein, partial [Planctomycetaceae bacterium]|nr:VCBS repeat-containing protein [Planctomycetaceae bacterium]
EELWAFENLGEGRFEKRLLHRWWNYDIGGAGLVLADLDSDGRPDLIVPVGDNLEDLDPYPQPYHGCFWFRNRGGWTFEARRIAEFGGTYAAAVADLNADGHQDVVLVSMANNFRRPGKPSIIWLENDGQQNFRGWQIDEEPTHLVTVACGDLTGDGRPDIVAGGLHLRSPYQRIGRVTAWMNRGPAGGAR